MEDAQLADVFEPERVRRVSVIMSRFNCWARVGDRVNLGVVGDKHMPKKYKESRPSGVITRIKHEGRPDSVLRVQLDSGRVVTIDPYCIDGSRLFDFHEDTWPNVMARANASIGTDATRASAAVNADVARPSAKSTPATDMDEASLRRELDQMRQLFIRRKHAVWTLRMP